MHCGLFNCIAVRRNENFTLTSDCIAFGLAILKNKLYVGCFSGTVKIYDISTLDHLSNLSIPGLGHVRDMTSCPQRDVVYIADSYNDMIHVIDERDRHSRWDARGFSPNSLSVNSQLNVVVVVFPESRKLREFTSRGQFVREITLQSEIKHPNHAIQLDEDRYVVADGCCIELHMYIVNGNGTIIKSFKENATAHALKRKSLRMLVIGESLIVSDSLNNRVQLFDVSSLTYVRELISARSEDEELRRLAVSDDGTLLFVSYDSHIRAFDITWI